MSLLALLLGLGMAPAWAGGLSLFLFDEEGAPLATELRVEPLPDALRTDEAGHLRVELPPGRYTLVLPTAQGPARRIEFTVAGADPTELLVQLQPTAAPTVSEEAADPSRAEEDSAGEPLPLSGRVIDERGAPVAGARIFVRGRTERAETGPDGRFQLLLPAGPRALSAVKSGFATQTLELEHGPDEAPVELRLVEAAHSLSFEVVAPRVEGGGAAMLEERRTSSQVSDVLGAEEMRRTGDSSAAGALRRVTGLTLVGGRYIYVRGLGERYSSTLLNGASLPSPEPERRVVPLDLFPTGVLDSVVVQKTFSPDMPAEFGGGTVALRTRGIPKEPLLELGLSGAWAQGTTGRAGLVAPGGKTDWLGVDDGTRALPTIVALASGQEKIAEGDMFSLSGYTAEELETFGEAMPNRWRLDERTLPPDSGGSLTAGHALRLPGVLELGGLVSGSYDQGWSSDEYERRYYLLGAGGALEEGHRYDFRETTREIMLGGIAVAGLRLLDDHELTLTELRIRNTDAEARIYQGFNRDLDGDLRVQRSRWLQRALRYTQLAADHRFSPLRLPGADPVGLRWHLAWTEARRYEPDRREWREDYEAALETWLLSDRPEGNQIVYSDLREQGRDQAVALALPFPVPFFEQQGQLQAGLGNATKERGVDTRRYKYMHKGPRSNDDAVLALDADEIFVPENIGNDGFQFEEITRETDNYQAEQQVGALWASLELPVTPSTRLLGGLRQETARQWVETFELFNPSQTPVRAELETKDLLPALGLVQKLPHEMQVRLGYGKTLSRPDFRELSPATFNDVTGGRQTYGNPDLERALIHNVDARWEWFPGPGEVLGVGAFYKRFLDPIEQIVIVSAQHSVTYANAEAATDLGVELDGRTFLGGLIDDRMFIGGNLAIIHSRVDLGESGGIESSRQRALQGQSPYVLNLQLGWEDPEAERHATLVYNVFGPRIMDVGALGAPDSYELPVHALDLVASQGLGAGFKLGLKAKNLLDWPARQTQGDKIVESVRAGRELGLKLSWSL